MVDLARLGFNVDSNELKECIAVLRTFNSNAKSANSSAKVIGSSMSAAAKVFSAAVLGMNKGILSLISSSKDATTAQIAAGKEAVEFAESIYKAASAEQKLVADTEKAVNSLNKLKKGLSEASGAAIANGNNFGNQIIGIPEEKNFIKNTISNNRQESKMVSRFNTANIAAQFQDVAVTAAMGMNPLTIALQQGTQLSAVLNMMEKPLEGMVIAFKSLFNATSLWTMGIIALVAAGLQMVDWMDVANSGLDALSSAMDFVIDHADMFAVAISGLAVALLVLNFTTILSSLETLAITLGKVAIVAVEAGLKIVAAGLSILTSPWVLIPAIVIGALEAFAMFKDNIKNFLNEAIDTIIDFVNKAIGYFVGLKQVIQEIPGLLKIAWDEGFSVANDKITEIMRIAQNQEYVGDNVKNAVNNAVDAVAEGVEKANKFAGQMVSTVGDVVAAGAEGVKKTIDDVKQKMYESTAEYKKQQKEAERLKEAWDDIVSSADENIAKLKMEYDLIGKSDKEITYQKTLFDLVNQAKNAGIVLDEKQLELLRQKAEKTALWSEKIDEANEKLDNQKEMWDDLRGDVKSFFQDFKDGIEEGKSLWESFGDAALNIMNKISDKMMDLAVDALFDGLSSNSGGKSSGNWLNMLFDAGVKGAMSAATGGMSAGADVATTSATSSSIINTASSTNASLNALFAAKGNAFTNGVVDSPTLFKFAKGGKFGVMGEAGPEAIMPLTRGPDGSLGVRASNDNGSAPVVVNVINNSDAQARTEKRQTEQGTTIDVIIDQMVSEKLGTPGTSSNSALTAFNNRQLVAR